MFLKSKKQHFIKNVLSLNNTNMFSHIKQHRVIIPFDLMVAPAKN